MKVATAIADLLKAEGTEYLFCFPVNALIDECARAGIRPMVGRTERTLGNMTGGYSRAGNAQSLGVAAVQHGPGAENAYAGVAQAFADGSPVLFLPGGHPATRADTPPISTRRRVIGRSPSGRPGSTRPSASPPCCAGRSSPYTPEAAPTPGEVSLCVRFSFWLRASSCCSPLPRAAPCKPARSASAPG
jgi:hypothetical protein